MIVDPNKIKYQSIGVDLNSLYVLLGIMDISNYSMICIYLCMYPLSHQCSLSVLDKILILCVYIYNTP